MKTFKAGQELSSATMEGLTAIVLSRTKCTVALNVDGKLSRIKIHSNDEGEFCYPLGRYSQAPIFRAGE